MIATFYNYTGNPKKVLKQLTNGYTLPNIKPYADFSENNPYLIISYNQHIYYNCNYAIIDSSYYFITDRELQTGNKMVLTCHKDVLTDILTVDNRSIVNLPVIVSRSTTDYNSYISDTMQGTQVNYTTYSMAFDSDFALSANIIVCAIGGE